MKTNWETVAGHIFPNFIFFRGVGCHKSQVSGCWMSLIPIGELDIIAPNFDSINFLCTDIESNSVV